MGRDLQIHEYSSDRRPDWESLVDTSPLGLVLHSRRFLDYHGDRFTERSLMFVEGDALVGIWPIVEAPQQADLAVSHAGSTFGGLILAAPNPRLAVDCIAAGSRRLLDLGYRLIRNKPVPALFTSQADETQVHVFNRAGASVTTGLWNMIRLERSYAGTPTREASARAASRRGISVRTASDDGEWSAFYAMLRSNLLQRHRAAPVHSLEELLALRDRLGTMNRLILAFDDQRNPVAGTWLLDYGQGTRHTQYIASTEDGRRLGAVDLLLETAIKQAIQDGCTQFSFGTSALPDNSASNAGLLDYKRRFGSGTCLQIQCEASLRDLLAASEAIWG